VFDAELAKRAREQFDTARAVTVAAGATAGRRQKSSISSLIVEAITSRHSDGSAAPSRQLSVDSYTSTQSRLACADLAHVYVAVASLASWLDDRMAGALAVVVATDSL
jgi:hypothetical protein